MSGSDSDTYAGVRLAGFVVAVPGVTRLPAGCPASSVRHSALYSPPLAGTFVVVPSPTYIRVVVPRSARSNSVRSPKASAGAAASTLPAGKRVAKTWANVDAPASRRQI